MQPYRDRSAFRYARQEIPDTRTALFLGFSSASVLEASHSLTLSLYGKKCLLKEEFVSDGFADSHVLAGPAERHNPVQQWVSVVVELFLEAEPANG